MGRALRIEGAGLWYHVMCRGNGGRYIFDDEKDYLAFLARLETVAAGYHVEVHAYVEDGAGTMRERRPCGMRGNDVPARRRRGRSARRWAV